MCSTVSARFWLSSTGIAAAVGCCSVTYPAALYAVGAYVSPLPFILLALALLVVTIGRSTIPIGTAWRGGLMVGALVLVVLAVVDERLAARAYPVIVTLGAAIAFGHSLGRPPSMIERFARLRHPDLGEEGQVWCTRVTCVWTVWLLVNAAIAAGLALSGDDRAWALWTGLLSYVGMAVLIAGEWLLRPAPQSTQGRP